MAKISFEISYVSIDGESFLINQESDNLRLTIKEALENSPLLEQVPSIDLEQCKIGIFNQICSLDHIVTDKTRIEVYNKLLQDPKAARKIRAQKK